MPCGAPHVVYYTREGPRKCRVVNREACALPWSREVHTVCLAVQNRRSLLANNPCRQRFRPKHYDLTLLARPPLRAVVKAPHQECPCRKDMIGQICVFIGNPIGRLLVVILYKKKMTSSENSATCPLTPLRPYTNQPEPEEPKPAAAPKDKKKPSI